MNQETVTGNKTLFKSKTKILSSRQSRSFEILWVLLSGFIKTNVYTQVCYNNSPHCGSSAFLAAIFEWTKCWFCPTIMLQIHMLAENLKQVWIYCDQVIFLCGHSSTLSTVFTKLDALGEECWIKRVDEVAQELFAACLRFELIFVW